MALYIVEKSNQISSLKEALEQNEIKDFKIISLAGHLLSLYDLKDYGIEGNWNELVEKELIPFFPEVFKRKIKPDSGYLKYDEIIKKIKPDIESAKEIILATDPDNEGSTLAMSLLEFLNMKHKVIGMVNMSKLDLISLKKEVNVINKIPFKTMYDAGESRAIFDWLFGINATVLGTVKFGGGQLLNIGAVKLPTIRMVVERDYEFENFSEIPYYTISAKAKVKDSIFDIKIQELEDDKFSSEEQALKIIETMKRNSSFKVSEFLEQTKTKAPPKPFSLTDLQAESNRRFKFSASDTLEIAQKLYLETKIQSYPRTDSNYYSEGEYELAKDILYSLSQIDKFKDCISNNINFENLMKRKIFDDSKIDAHTALSPLASINTDIYTKLENKQQMIFNLVANRYIMQFMNDYKYIEIKGIANFENGKILFNENIKVESGWKVIATKDENDNENSIRTIPQLNKDDEIEILFETIEIKKSFAKPKPRFKEATLLQAMTKVHRFFDDQEVKKFLGENGIGTPATRANILEELKNARKGDIPYLILNDNGDLVSTEKARFLINTLPKELSSPILRAKMEEKLKLMVKGEILKSDYIKEIKVLVEKVSKVIKSLDNKSLKIERPTETNNELIETPKTFRKGDVFIFKTFRNITITKAQAEKLLSGKKILLKLKSKENKDYELELFVKDGKLESVFPNKPKK